MVAYVRSGNERSRRAFTAAGFVPDAESDRPGFDRLVRDQAYRPQQGLLKGSEAARSLPAGG